MATVFAMRFAAGSYASRMRLSSWKSVWYFAKSERASTSRRSSTIPTTSSVSTPLGIMRSERSRAYACNASTAPVSSTST